MRKILSMVVAIFFTLALVCPAVSLADPEQNMILSVKKDPGGGYLNSDMDGVWYYGSLGFENLITGDPEGHTRWGAMAFSAGPPTDLDVGGFDFDSSEGDPPTSYTLDDATFSVDPDGVVHLNTNPGSQTTPPKGYLSQNREYLVVRHPTVWEPGVYDDIQIQIALGIKQGSGLDNSSLSGTYHLRVMEAYDTSTPDRSAATYWGTITFDGSGNWTIDDASAHNSDGTTENALNDTGTYAVSDDGSLTFTPSSGEIRYGQLSSNGNVMYASVGFETIDGYEHNGLLVGIKASGTTFSNADLSGEYYYVQLVIDNFEGARDGNVNWGLITFDGAGAFTLQLDVFDADDNSDRMMGSGTYSVGANGDVTMIVTQLDGQSVNTLSRGHISESGQFAALTSDGTNPPPPPGGGGGGGGGGCFISLF